MAVFGAATTTTTNTAMKAPDAPGLVAKSPSSEGGLVGLNDDRSDGENRDDDEHPQCLLTTAPSSSGNGVEILGNAKTGKEKKDPTGRRERRESRESKGEGINRVSTGETSEIMSEDEKEEAEFDQAINCACALVGENVIDSPVGLQRKRIQLQERAVSQMRNSSLADAPLTAALPSHPPHQPLSAKGESSRSYPSTVRPNNAKPAPMTPPSSPLPHPTSSSASLPPAVKTESSLESTDMSVGIMAHGLAWVQRQRDRRRRLYLQNQAQQQLNVIRQAQLREKLAQEQQQDDRSRSLTDNPTFQTVAKALRTFTVAEDDGAAGGGSSVGTGEYSLEEAQDGAQTCNAAIVSQSGDGYSITIPVSDDEDREEEDELFVPPVRVQEIEPDDPPFLLTHAQMQQIACNVLPRGIAYCKWKRLYSLARDGDSFDACLRLIGNDKQTLLVVRTSRNDVLGGFADMPWNMQHHNGSYYGGPNACLWHVVNDKVVVYRWSGSNRYIQLLDHSHTMIAFGGGDDENSGGGAHFGLSVEQDFRVGSTGPCATFHNQPLCDQETFDIVDLEIYGFLIGQF